MTVSSRSAPDSAAPPQSAVALLRTTATIRTRANGLLVRARSGGSAWFIVDDDALPAAAIDVASITRRRYPGLRIPFHSRWRHFEAGGIDRVAAVRERFADDPAEQARSLIDLAVVSVLLDAGAGPDWSYHDTVSGTQISRSEGLGVASLDAFVAGLFSGDPDRPLRADPVGLRSLTPDALGEAFQVSTTNPLVGLDGRVELLHRLGDALMRTPEVFGTDPRPGHLYDVLTASGRESVVGAHDILTILLDHLSGIWPSDNRIGDIALGDCWRHSSVAGPGLTDGWMPFHKLSQWLTYSLLEPFGWAGCVVTGVDELTALPEYRNGGLLLDTGVLRHRDPTNAGRTWSAGDELVVEWRALTVALLDELAPLVRAELGVTAEQLPLACVLEGGTWAAGRDSARRLRGGLPPFHIDSDGTVF